MPRRDLSEVTDHMKRQIAYLREDAAAYDGGDEGRAVRLASTLRLLVHTKGRSTSLLDQLGVTSSLRFWDTATPYSKGVQWPTLLQLRLPGGFRPRLADQHPPVRRQFGEWWTGTVDRLHTGAALSRSDFVLALSDREGGVHLDPDVDPLHHALDRENIYGWNSLDPSEPLARNMTTACVRQIAFEVDQTLSEQLADSLE